MLDRNHSRLNQTSIDILRSWRGNCDIQMLIYDSNPDLIDVREISRVTDYVVGYIGKGNSTMLEEKETNKQIVLKHEEMTGDNQDLKNLAKKIMNKAASSRLISKQEACLMLGGLQLTTCSDLMSTVSIANNKRLSTDQKKKDNTFIGQYERRTEFLDLSLHQYFRAHRKKRGIPPAIPHFTGMTGEPTFPVTESYARRTLIVHKPWRKYPNPSSWKKEFDRFINSKDCPISARMQYERVMQRYYNGTKFVDPKSSVSNHDPQCVDEEDEAMLLLAGMNASKNNDFDDSIEQNIHRGQDYPWDGPTKVSENFQQL